MAKAAADYGATALISNHTEFDNAFFKAHAAADRRNGEANPFDVGADARRALFCRGPGLYGCCEAAGDKKIERERMNLKKVVLGRSCCPEHGQVCCFPKAERRTRSETKKGSWEKIKVTASPSKGIWRATLRIATCSFIFRRLMPRVQIGAIRSFTSFTVTPRTPRTTGNAVGSRRC